jgi:YHS domain-containing protein
MKHILVIAALLFTLVPSAVLATPKHTAAKQVLICPVTGEVISSISDAAGHSVYKGKTYYFCCSGCKPMFDANPAKYVKSMAKIKSSGYSPT